MADNLLQKLFQDLVGTNEGHQIEAVAQPFITAFVNPIVGAFVNSKVSKSPTLQAILADLESPGAPLDGLSTTQTTGSAIDTAIAALTAQIASEIAGVSAPKSSGPTLAQIVTVYNTALANSGVPTVDETTLDAAFTAAANGAVGLTESEALASINSSLTAEGLPAADDATFDSAFTAAWVAAGYAVPANPPLG